MVSEYDFEKRLMSLYSHSIIPAVFYRADGELFFANKAAGVSLSSILNRSGLEAVINGNIDEIFKSCAESELPMQVTFGSSFAYSDAMLTPIYTVKDKIFFKLSPGERRVESTAAVSPLLDSDTESLLRESLDYPINTITLAVRSICARETELSQSDKDRMEAMVNSLVELKTCFALLLRSSALIKCPQKTIISLSSFLDEISNLSGCITVLGDGKENSDINISGDVFLLTECFTDIIRSLLVGVSSQGGFSRLPVRITSDKGYACIKFSCTGNSDSRLIHLVYTPDGDIYPYDLEYAFRIIKSESGRLLYDATPEAESLTCIFPLIGNRNKTQVEDIFYDKSYISSCPPAITSIRCLNRVRRELSSPDMKKSNLKQN